MPRRSTSWTRPSHHFWIAVIEDHLPRLRAARRRTPAHRGVVPRGPLRLPDRRGYGVTLVAKEDASPRACRALPCAARNSPASTPTRPTTTSRSSSRTRTAPCARRPRNDRQALDWPQPMPTTRDYTVRRHSGDTPGPRRRRARRRGRLDVGGGTPRSVRPGHGGRSARRQGIPLPACDNYVLAVDATALPAAARWLEDAPSGTGRAHLVVEEVDDPVEHEYPLPRAPTRRSTGSRAARSPPTSCPSRSRPGRSSSPPARPTRSVRSARGPSRTP